MKEGGCIPREMRFPSGPGIPPGLSKLKDRGGRLCSTNEVNHLLIWTPCKKGRLENVTITTEELCDPLQGSQGYICETMLKDDSSMNGTMSGPSQWHRHWYQWPHLGLDYHSWSIGAGLWESGTGIPGTKGCWE